MADDLTCTCPHCGNTIGFDEAGDPIALETISATERRGVRGLIVEEASPGWDLARYHSNNQAEHSYLNYPVAQPFVTPQLQAEVEHQTATDSDSAITEEQLLDVAALSMANTKDLKDRNIL